MSVAVVTNPKLRARDPRRAEVLAGMLGDRAEVAAPADLDALAASAAGWKERGIDLVCVHGGDGTVHQVATAIVRTWGEGGDLPRLCILRGGTMNIVADSVGVRIDAEAMLGQVADGLRSGEALPTVTRRIMRIDVDDRPPLYGFLSGNGIIARFLELYYEDPEPSPRSAAVLLMRGAVSAFVRGPLIRQLTRPYLGQVVVDGVALPGERWVAVALGTVEQMGLGFRVFHLLAAHPDELQVVGIGSSVAALAVELASLYRGRGVHRAGNVTRTARRIGLVAEEPIPLMIDGDFCRADHGRVTVSVGPEVRFVVPRPGGA